MNVYYGLLLESDPANALQFCRLQLDCIGILSEGICYNPHLSGVWSLVVLNSSLFTELCFMPSMDGFQSGTWLLIVAILAS